MKILSFFSFFLFSFFYLTTASSIALPSSSTLRWVGGFLLVLCVLLENRLAKEKISLKIPNQYVYIFIALVPTLFGVGGNAIFYGYGRIISFFLVAFGLQFFLDMKILAKKDFFCMLEIHTLLSGAMMLLSAVSNEYEQGRLAGAYANANQLSGIAVQTVVFALCMFFLKKGKLIRWLYLGIVITSCYCVFETGSRMGAACMVVIIFLIPFIAVEATTQTKFKQLLMIVFSALLLFLLLEKFEVPGLQRLLDFSEETTSTGLFRSATWKDVYEIFAEKPLFGWGYGQVSYQTFEEATTSYNWGIHSSYFVILCEMGIAGVLLFLTFFISYFAYIGKLIKSTDFTHNEKIFVKFLVLSCIVGFVNAYSESFLFSFGNPMTIGFWISFVMLFSFLNKKRSEAKELEKENN